jgi:hypothetical protein
LKTIFTKTAATAMTLLAVTGATLVTAGSANAVSAGDPVPCGSALDISAADVATGVTATRTMVQKELNNFVLDVVELDGDTPEMGILTDFDHYSPIGTFGLDAWSDVADQAQFHITIVCDWSKKSVADFVMDVPHSTVITLPDPSSTDAALANS